MIEEKLLILHEILGQYIRESKEQFLFCCPKCSHHKPKLAVNIKKDVFKCWICAWRGDSLRFLVEQVKPALLREWNALDGIYDFSDLAFSFGEHKSESAAQLTLPKEFISLVSDSLPEYIKPFELYLRNRGIERRDIALWRLGCATEGPYANSIIVPSFDKKGEINYFVSRNISKFGKKYNNPQKPTNFIFNEMYVDWSRPIVLVEGVFDMFKAGLQSIPLLGSSLSESSTLFQEIVQHKSVVFMALDFDARLKENKIIELLMSYGICVNRIPALREKDIGAMAKEEFEELKKRSFVVTDALFFAEEFLS
jgi:DNA primase